MFNRENELSLQALQKMKSNHTQFFTAGGRRRLWIAEVNEVKKTLRFERSTGKISWNLSYDKLKYVYDKVNSGEIMFDYKVIDEIIPTFGNYAVGLLRNFGCK